VDRWWLRSSVQLQTISLTLTGLGINPRRMRLRMSPTTGLSFDLIRKPSANPICGIKLCDGLTNWSMKWLSNFALTTHLAFYAGDGRQNLSQLSRLEPRRYPDVCRK
jgi:hypothetical protein